MGPSLPWTWDAENILSGVSNKPGVLTGRESGLSFNLHVHVARDRVDL